MQDSIFLTRLFGPLLLPGLHPLVNQRAFRTVATEVTGGVTPVYPGLVLFYFGDVA